VDLSDRKLILGCALFFALYLVSPMLGDASQLMPGDLTRAIFSLGRLWVLSDAGELSFAREGQDKWTVESFPERVLDLCNRDGHPTVITGAKDDAAAWTIRGHRGDQWSIEAVIQSEDDGLISMDCRPDRVTVITARRLVEVIGDRQTTVPLSSELKRGLINPTYGTEDRVFLGRDSGEWGGGLRSIDRSNGEITVLERNESGDLCGGPLSTSCDPVTGIAPEPWKPDCVAVAVGLIHFAPHGRIVEVCGSEIRRLYYKPYTDPFGAKPRSGRRKDDEPFSTVAFFGLVGDSDTLLTAGIDGIYRIGSGGVVQFFPQPQFKEIGGIKLSFDLPHVVLVLTGINRRESVSGLVPLLVPR